MEHESMAPVSTADDDNGEVDDDDVDDYRRVLGGAAPAVWHQ